MRERIQANTAKNSAPIRTAWVSEAFDFSTENTFEKLEMNRSIFACINEGVQ